MQVVAQPLSAAANAPWNQYGSGNKAMETLLGQFSVSNPVIEYTEVFSRSEYLPILSNLELNEQVP